MATMKKKRAATPREGTRVAIYARRSVADEGRSKSCDQQVEQCLLACSGLGFTVPSDRIYREIEGAKGDWWFDDGTASKPGPFRTQLTRLVHDIREGLIDRVVVWRTDRLYRDSAIAHEFLELLRETGARLYVKTTDLAVHTASGLQSAMTEAAANRGYRDRIGEDIKRDKDYKAALGLITGNASCFGFRSKGNGSREVEPVWEELDTVLNVFRWFVQGDGGGPMNRGSIARRLMASGITLSTSARGHHARNVSYVSEQRVKTLLKNPIYAGRWLYDGVSRDCPALLISRNGEDPHPALPLDLFEAAQTRLAGYATTPARSAASEKRPLAGLVVCAVCGRNLHVNVGKVVAGERHERWFCAHRATGACVGAGYGGLRVSVLDEWSRTYLADMVCAEYTTMMAERRPGSSAEELATMEGRLEAHVREEGKRLARALSILDDDQYAAVAAELRRERSQLESRVAELRTDLRSERESGLELDLRSLSPQAFGAAMRRCVKWIAIGEFGAIVLTRFGVYIGAALEATPSGRLVQAGDYRKLLPPGALASRSCLEWIPDHRAFVEGLSSHRTSTLRGAAPETILPENPST